MIDPVLSTRLVACAQVDINAPRAVFFFNSAGFVSLAKLPIPGRSDFAATAAFDAESAPVPCNDDSITSVIKWLGIDAQY